MIKHALAGLFWACAALTASAWAAHAQQVETIDIPSPALKRAVPAVLYLPPGYSPDNSYRLVVLLHGQTSSPEDYASVGVFEAATDLIDKGEIVPLVMVIPAIDNSYGINSATAAEVYIDGIGMVDFPKGNYEDFLTADLPTFMADTYSAGTVAADRVYAGISMGGYAALRIGLAFPDLATRIAGHSPAIVGRSFRWLFPDKAAWQERSLPLLAERYEPTDQYFYLDCGQQDEHGFFLQSLKMSKILKDHGAVVAWHPAPGYHDGAYWQAHVTDYVRFYGAP